jgi:hypothetical protein
MNQKIAHEGREQETQDRQAFFDFAFFLNFLVASALGHVPSPAITFWLV